MSSNPRRRTTSRRRLPPRPTYQGSAPAPASGGGDEGASRGRHGAHDRAVAAAARESRYMLREMKRVALVSGSCLGLLAILTVVDRLSG
ncbi:MAG: hypothetical protein R3C39_11620 [Dehalococcoidia bacterium]